MKSRVASGAALVAFLLAIVIFNQIFPLALNIAIALISVMGVVEIISALGMSKNYILMIPSVAVATASGHVAAGGLLYLYRCDF